MPSWKIFQILLMGICMHSIYADCPPTCQCYGTTVNCEARFQQTTDLDPNTLNIPEGTTSLNFGSNKLTKIRRDWFQTLSNLTQLYLDGNEIETIESGFFNGLKSIEGLELKDNRLKKITKSMFLGASSLTFLSLGNNKIETIESGSFNGLKSIEQIVLSYNNLTKFTKSMFLGASKLKGIDLAGNMIDTIESGFFNGLESIEGLSLFDNILTKITKSMFLDASNLKSLVLDGDVCIDDDAFSDFKNLDITFIGCTCGVIKQFNILKDRGNLAKGSVCYGSICGKKTIIPL